MPISKQQDDHHEHYDHDQHRNNHSNHNNVEYRYSLEKNRNCTTTMNTTADNRLESMFHQKKMIQSSSSSSSSRSLPPQFEIPKTLMRNISMRNDNNNINDSEKSMKFLRGLYSTLPGMREKQQRRNTKRDGDDDDDDDDEEEITIVPIQYDNYVNKRQIISRNKASIAGKRRNELLLDDASEIYDAIQAMKSEFEGLSFGDVEILLYGDEEDNGDDDDDDEDDDDDGDDDDDDDNNDYDL